MTTAPKISQGREYTELERYELLVKKRKDNGEKPYYPPTKNSHGTYSLLSPGGANCFLHNTLEIEGIPTHEPEEARINPEPPTS